MDKDGESWSLPYVQCLTLEIMIMMMRRSTTGWRYSSLPCSFLQFREVTGATVNKSLTISAYLCSDDHEVFSLYAGKNTVSIIYHNLEHTPYLDLYSPGLESRSESLRLHRIEVFRIYTSWGFLEGYMYICIVLSSVMCTYVLFWGLTFIMDVFYIS